MNEHFVWNVDPVLFRLGGLEVRYYGLCFGIALVTGFLVWYKRATRYGVDPIVAEKFIWFIAPGVFVGGRLGHCFFYRPQDYLADPVRILYIWDGGVSSHGVAIGIAFCLWLYARRYKFRWIQLGDLFVPGIALAVGWIRVGNFFNSEVLGHPTDVPWAVVFARHDMVPRHAAQLYDLLMAPATWLVLRAVEKRHIRPIGSGLLSGTFLAVYFGLRIWVEQFKDFYVEQLRSVPPFSTVEELLGVRIHTGQWLSLIPCALGVFLIVRALRRFRGDDREPHKKVLSAAA